MIEIKKENRIGAKFNKEASNISYMKFANFTLYLFSKIGVCHLKIREAINIVDDFFHENPNIDYKLKELLITLLNEWDTSFYEICDLIEYIFLAGNFERLEKLILSNPELKDIVCN